jgi:hypothetical protein
LEAYERSVIEEQFIPLKEYVLEYASDYVENLTFALIKYAGKKHVTDGYLGDHLDEDLQLLAHDKKFLNSMQRVRKRFDICYRQFTKYQK